MNYEEAKRELSITRAREKCLRDAVAYFEATDKAERARLKASYEAKRVRVNERIRSRATPVVVGSGLEYGGRWIEWRGGHCPVSADTRVEAKVSGFGNTVKGLARGFQWDHVGYSDILAYRVIQ